MNMRPQVSVSAWRLNNMAWSGVVGALSSYCIKVKNLCDQLEAFGMKNYEAGNLSQIMKGINSKLWWDKAVFATAST